MSSDNNIPLSTDQYDDLQQTHLPEFPL